MKLFITVVAVLTIAACSITEETQLRLWYDEPAQGWPGALPVGNGRLGAMVFGGVEMEHIQFNEETLWTGEPNDYAHQGAKHHLDEIRHLLFEGQQEEAHELAMQEFMSVPLTQKEYQPFGDIYLEFPGHQGYSEYSRELDLSNSVCKTSYVVDGIHYTREVIASNPHQVIAIHIDSDKAGSLTFSLKLDSEHEEKSIQTDGDYQVLSVAVKDGALKGTAGIKVETDGTVSNSQNTITVTRARTATIWLSAATNFVSYTDVSNDPLAIMERYLDKVEGKTFREVMNYHKADYQSLFGRFSIDFGTNGRDTIPTNE
ncbi:MAG: glycoside hydrolase family 95 protein, partial [Bacteroidales bacterium]|nr:glycoside hydrolase family 95 protein [Bacteroidales bacterium]